MESIIFEIMKALLCGAIGVLIKMYADIIKLKTDVRAAHKKIRKMGKK